MIAAGRDIRGSALVEIVISTLVVVMAVAAITAALLSGSVQESSSEAREQLAVAMGQLHEELKNYVSADLTPGPDAPGVEDPPDSGTRTWRLPGDSCAACWALQEGEHDVTARLSSDLTTRYGATMKYVVTASAVNGLVTRQMVTRVQWEVPK
ncbi:MAG: hypothetical protein A2X36_16360 [Elusimicrobia bacterium GWA2_69_24]|nr:MAG: hypothetical protein A2X36_16360 [Elusimicrobia bacterium GWA2_69_24]HBL16732.1 hypothetical protein [Elusimicrobiota bacterium]